MMKSLISALMLALWPISAAANDDLRSAFLGPWGTPTQCNGDPIIAGGTKIARPFVVGNDWLQHGEIWCRLTWFPGAISSPPGFATARALCGEDGNQGYRLDFVTTADGLLLIWDENLINGPLQRCKSGGT